MNRHQGGLAVESAEGEGASFLVYFPLAHAPQQPAAAVSAGAGTTGAPPLDMNVMKASS
jgi:hypothetical protein